jgi:predicted DNA-binding transcriptional regulator AlpA
MTALLALLAVLLMATIGDVWLTRPQLADRLKVSVKTLAMWASANKGPRYARPGGGGVRYRLSDVEAWEATQFGGHAA